LGQIQLLIFAIGVSKLYSGILTHFQKYIELNLLQLIADGDERAFRKLVEIYTPILFPGLNKIIRDAHVCEDLMQETYLRIWLHRDKLPGIENPRAWILKIAYLRAFSYLRSVRNQTILKENLAQKNPVASNDMQEAIDFNTLSKLVATAVSKLPVQQKRVYQLSREGDYTQNEIAEILGLAPQTVKNTMGRATQFIRDYISKSGYLLLPVPLVFMPQVFFY
jgi:RNA polymerase sigma factor (sigma-70 family)